MRLRPADGRVMLGRTALRRWALQVLVAWLFGIAAGVANACALAQLVDDARPRAAAGAHASHDDRGHDRANCADFCAKASFSAPKQSSGDEALATVLTCAAPRPPVIQRLGPAAAGIAALPCPPGSKPPLRITLQRLAL